MMFVWSALKLMKDKWLAVIILFILCSILFVSIIASRCDNDPAIVMNVGTEAVMDNNTITHRDTSGMVISDVYVPPEGKVTVRPIPVDREIIDSISNGLCNILSNPNLTTPERIDTIENYLNIIMPLLSKRNIAIDVKAKGLTFRPFFGAGYYNKPDLVFGAKILYYKRYGIGIGFGRNGVGAVVSRRIDDLVKLFRNIEVFIETGTTYKSKLMFGCGLLVTL